MALEIADRIQALSPAPIGVDERITSFIGKLDELVSLAESPVTSVKAAARVPYHFEYGGKTFEVKLIDG